MSAGEMETRRPMIPIATCMFSPGKRPSIQRPALGLNSACASSRTEATPCRRAADQSGRGEAGHHMGIWMNGATCYGADMSDVARKVPAVMDVAEFLAWDAPT